MKKLILFLFMICALCAMGFSQTTEVKTKKTSTIPQKVHNTFSKHKRYNGTVTKTSGPNHKRKHKHTTKKEAVKVE